MLLPEGQVNGVGYPDDAGVHVRELLVAEDCFHERGQTFLAGIELVYFIDDDESEHAPDYDMGPRNPDEPIGEFATLAFIVNKKFKQAMMPGQDSGDAGEITHQTEEERKKLEAND